MSHLKEQKDLTKGKGWAQVLSETNKEVLDKYKTKVQNIWGGIKATPSFIKKNIGKE